MGIELVELSNLLEYQKEFITVNDEEEYKRCTAKLNRQGIVLRDVIKGKDIKTKKQQVCKAGQLLVAEIDAKVGGYGIVPPELEGAIVSSHYFLFNVNEEKLNRLYLHYYLKTDDFFNQIKPQGTTNYASIRPRDVLKIKIPLPSLEKQKEIVEKLDRYFKNEELFNKQNENNSEILNKLRQSILQEAIQGKLVPQDPNDEPASVLLERIKEEKERLIKEGKIKIEKSLPPISEDEIPYELPKGWEWVRITDIVALNDNSIRRGPFGSAIRKDMFVPKGENTYKVYEQQNAIKKDYTLGTYYINETKFKELRRFSVEPNDIIISCAGTIGETYLLPEGIPEGIINQALLKVRLNNSIIDNSYFLYLFDAYVKYKINMDAKGSAMKNLVSVDYLQKKVLFPLPPLNEQKRIVKKLDKLMVLCDELEKNVEQSKKDSELLMQSVLQEAFKEA